MHLVQDMSVPEHARNDGHYTYAYEEWVRDTPIVINNALANPKYPDSTVISRPSPFTQAPVSIANLFDTKQYNGSNPAATVALSFGLSEYSNANFLTAETIFRNGFPYPAWSSVIEYDETDQSTGKKRTYLRKITDGEQIGHVARGTWFFKYLPTAMKSSGFGLKLDKQVYADYAPLLLPRAVGYSAALLDYFFRGNINITFQPDDVTFRSVKVTAQNDTPGETMGTGEARLVIRYKALAETSLGGGKYLVNYPPEGTSLSDYSYKVSKPLNADLTSPQQLTFDFSDDPLPYNFDDMTMQLVFKGKLGNEENSVAVSKLEVIDGIYTDFTLSLPPSGVYAKTTANSFSELRVTALSSVPGGLSGGTISLALEYRTAIGDQFQSVPVDTEPADAVGYIARIPEKNNVSTLPQGTSVELVFDLSSVQLPVSATDVGLNIVYSKADFTTQAIGVRDISEPTPVDVYNNTDYSCLNNRWYRYDDTAAMAIVDSNGDGIPDRSDIYPRNITDIAFLAAPAGAGTLDPTTANTLFVSGPVQTGQMRRLGYILTDYSNSYAYSAIKEGNAYFPARLTVPQTNTGQGFRNDGEIQSTMFLIRGEKMWGSNGVVFINNEYPSGSSCTWADLNQLVGQ